MQTGTFYGRRTESSPALFAQYSHDTTSDTERLVTWSLPQWVHILLGFGNSSEAEWRLTTLCQNTHSISCFCHVIRARITSHFILPSAIRVLGEEITAIRFWLNSHSAANTTSLTRILLHFVFYFVVSQ